MKQLYKYSILWLIGGLIYYFIELLYRGYSHFTMVALGGCCFILLGLINEILNWETPLCKQAVLGGGGGAG